MALLSPVLEAHSEAVHVFQHQLEGDAQWLLCAVPVAVRRRNVEATHQLR